jgi:uncharacterized membrane protein (DUF106 family)
MWISLAIAIITGLTALITYLLGDKRKIRILKERMAKLEEKLKIAEARNDTVGLSRISLELDRVRWQLISYTHGK